ncbi:hypothetical protein DAPPUDRAFT_334128 [Daphnia pulex]|uniref:Uncharacterized protein n=1 Tax=Daphnia pulex TaxID=6669 RepID=E9HUS9_DAPPU|nr:hypothetical protein DAPPUDRAFT_334128 [Daphnia pulex]|eukprot:EFX64500.1 hypothetical protein DAPPUDRAFT_334128 [Daphnia pulex]
MTSKRVTQIRWILCLIAVLICLSKRVMSSPVTGDLSRSTRVGPEGPEFWIQPCGYTVEGNTPPFPDSALARDYKSYLEMDLHYLEELWLEQFVSLFDL